MSDSNQNPGEQTAAFQKIWMDSMSRLMQTAFASGQNSPPPEVLREIRGGIFQALAKSWEEFMRSPEFLEGMKQWMDQAMNFRKMSGEFLSKVRNEFQAPSHGDIDSVMLSIRHMEKRLLDRMEEMAREIDELKTGRGKRRAAARNGKRAAAARKPAAGRNRSGKS